MTEQIIEILKISSLIIFNLSFLILIIIGLVFLQLGLKLNKMRKSMNDDYNEVVSNFKTKINNIDTESVEIISSVTAGIINGISKPKKQKSSFGVAKKIFGLFTK